MCVLGGGCETLGVGEEENRVLMYEIMKISNVK